MATKPFINVDAVEFRENGAGERFRAKLARVGPLIGAKGLGCTVTVVPPGKRAFPFHCHHVNEEMFFILSGTGTLRFGSEQYTVRAGDIIATPPGGPEVAHQLINHSSAELRYLAISTLSQPEIVEYPDSEKFAVMSGMPASGDYRKARLAHIGRTDQSLDYWDGEVEANPSSSKEPKNA